jgi:hypothetical protein
VRARHHALGARGGGGAGLSPERLVFIDDNPVTARMNGQQVCRYEEFLALPASSRHVVIGIASSRIREKLALRCRRMGCRHGRCRLPMSW